MNVSCLKYGVGGKLASREGTAAKTIKSTLHAYYVIYLCLNCLIGGLCLSFVKMREALHPAIFVLVIVGLLLMSIAVSGSGNESESLCAAELTHTVDPPSCESIWVTRMTEEEHLEVWAMATDADVEWDEDESCHLPSLLVHTVESGDNLWNLAVYYRTTIETINELNDLSNLHHLKLGTNLLIIQNARGTLHRVAEGEDLEAIAKKHEVDVAVILNTNDIDPDGALTVGEKLIVPTGPAKTPMETTLAARSNSGFIWPLRGRITSGFGWRWGRMHNGIDIWARTGDPIAAARSGRVTFAGWNGGYGNLIIISHGSGVETRYAHLSRINVSVGQQVASGQVIGRAGSTGFSTGPHLHFEIRMNGTPVDPRRYLP